MIREYKATSASVDTVPSSLRLPTTEKEYDRVGYLVESASPCKSATNPAPVCSFSPLVSQVIQSKKTGMAFEGFKNLEPANLKTSKEREIWETTFEQKYVLPYTSNLSSTAHGFRQQIAGSDSLKNEIEETNLIVPSKEFCFVIVLHRRLLHRISRTDALQITFSKLFSQEDLGLTGKPLRAHQDSLIDLFTSFEYASIICMALVDDKDLCAILEHLCNIQSRFIADVLAIDIKSCMPLKFAESTVENSEGDSVLQIPLVQLEMIRESQIVDYSWSDDLLDFSQYNLEYGQGLAVIYDLQKIENELVAHLMVGKAIVFVEDGSPPLPYFQYQSELFCNSARLMAEIRKFIPQETAPIEKQAMIMTIDKKEPSKLLGNFDILLSFLRQTPGHPDQMIIEYEKMWNLGSGLVDADTREVFGTWQLKHILCLYVYIEEVVPDFILGSIDKQYQPELSAEKKRLLQTNLPYDSSSFAVIAGSLKRFMLQSLAYKSVRPVDRLLDYMIDNLLKYWPSEYKEDKIESSIPECILVEETLEFYNWVNQHIAQSSRCSTVGETTGNTARPKGKEKMALPEKKARKFNRA
ncbi:hypothetical protein K493DRAFT_366594 [Basidiobolus meristosporus CBS 931.73]|uniref:Uncharacterized protein n=1 Tax=Basidiobolus meristosporus CBS 931.73 TaxID=1314790 RepID=A0A1Y1WF12_9FUNG|nr:hypothetical protein K493DRAFT_366594 [Basidiobolus meristosporus CBS 931.73]|eukprot:ORX71744.1 hypothetical protein K493DRAFT_366594 [Basidiobolus meristosporus CBS 931.73]